MQELEGTLSIIKSSYRVGFYNPTLPIPAPNRRSLDIKSTSKSERRQNSPEMITKYKQKLQIKIAGAHLFSIYLLILATCGISFLP
jgi:hypothetical protein